MSDFVQNYGAEYKSYQVNGLDARLSHDDSNRNQIGLSRLHKDKHRRNDPNDQSVSETSIHADISVSALILFLEEMIQDAPPPKQNSILNMRDRKEAYLAPWMRVAPSNGNARMMSQHAAQAYSSASKTSKNITVSRDAPKDHNTLRRLLVELKLLQTRGVHHLQLQNNISFIDSISSAVAQALGATSRQY